MNVDETKQPSLTSQSAWILSAKIISFLFNLILPLLVVRYLTQDMVGVYRQAFLVIVNATAILPLGFSMSAYYFLNRDPEKRCSTIFNILLFNAATGGLACLTLVLFPQVIGDLFQSSEMRSLAPLIGFVIWLWIFSAFLEIVALANREVKLATVFIIAAQLSKTAMMVGAVVWYGTVRAMIFAVLLQGLGQTLAMFIYLNSRFPRWWSSFRFKFLLEHVAYTLPYGLAGLLYTVRTDIHNYFVAYKFSSAEFAIYSYGFFQVPLIWALYESISAVLLPKMSQLQEQGKNREMMLISLSGVEKLAFAYFPLFVFLLIVSEEFITTLFTQNYAASVPIFRINLLILPFYCLILDPLERSFKELGLFITKVRAVLLIALVAALYYGIRHLQLPGIAAIVVVMIICERMIVLWKVLSFLGVGVKDAHLLKRLSKITAASVISGVVLLALYLPARDVLLAGTMELSRAILGFAGLSKADGFLGGALFLGICLMLYSSMYLAAAAYLGAIEDNRKERFFSVLSRFGRWSVSKRIKLAGSPPGSENA